MQGQLAGVTDEGVVTVLQRPSQFFSGRLTYPHLAGCSLCHTRDMGRGRRRRHGQLGSCFYHHAIGSIYS